MEPSTEDATILTLWLDAANEHELHEYAVVRAIWCDPPAGWRCAREAGVNANHFRQREDLRWMFLAFGIAGRFGPRRVCSVLRRAFREEGWWNEQIPAGHRGPMWSTHSLAAFAVEFCDFASPMQSFVVRKHAADLLEANARLRDAEAHYRHAMRILQPELLPPHLRENAPSRREVAA